MALQCWGSKFRGCFCAYVFDQPSDLEAFLKKIFTAEQLDRQGHTMALLVDGRAISFRQEFENLFHNKATGLLQQHPDWQSLDESDQQFAMSTLAFMLVQNSCSFQRRVEAPLSLFLAALLSLARVRYDLPDEARKKLAKQLIETPTSALDFNTLKIVNTFRSDLAVAASSGKIGVQLWCVLKGLRRMWRPTVIEQERLNKQLTLMGERAPNSSLDLISARLCLKYHLGTAGLGEAHLRDHAQKPTSTRKWSHIRPVAANLMNKCVDHWFDVGKVLSSTERFSDTFTPEWCPNKEEVQKWFAQLDPGSVKNKQQSACHLMAAAINRKLFQFWNRDRASSDSGSSSNSAILEPLFAAVALVEGEFQRTRPVRLAENTSVWVYGETVNRSVRIAEAIWKESKVWMRQPWNFAWAADVFLEILKRMTASSKPLTLLAFPVAWGPASSASASGDNASFIGSLKSKNGQHTFVTIVQWEEAAWSLHRGCPQVRFPLRVVWHGLTYLYA